MPNEETPTYIIVDRKYFDSPLWKLTPSRQRTKSEAYLDLFQMATYKKNTYTTPDCRTTINLNRGEGVWSIRFLAKRWHWSRGKVETFLKLLKDTQKARQYSRQGVMVTFLVDYDNSQDPNNYGLRQKKDTVQDGLKTGSRQGQDKYNKGKKGKKVKKKTIKEKMKIPPDKKEVAEYISERGNKIDVDLWYDTYQSKGWMIGKNKMKDWKAAVRTWERNRFGQQEKPNKKAENQEPKGF